jgi:uncharacterized protein YegP (UPF0339 family)
MDTPAMRITVDRASGGYRVHVWAGSNEELLFWSDIYASREGAQRAAFQLKTQCASAAIDDRTGAAVSA